MFNTEKKNISEKDYHFTLLQENYLMRRKHDIGVFRKANEQKDFEKIKTMAHQIVGNSEMYGFGSLGVFAKDILLYSDQKNQDLIEESIIKYNHFLDTLEL